jgi:hypothetical protein
MMQRGLNTILPTYGDLYNYYYIMLYSLCMFVTRLICQHMQSMLSIGLCMYYTRFLIRTWYDI